MVSTLLAKPSRIEKQANSKRIGGFYWFICSSCYTYSYLSSIVAMGTIVRRVRW